MEEDVQGLIDDDGDVEQLPDEDTSTEDEGTGEDVKNDEVSVDNE